jgi:tyrosinase
MYVRQRLTSYLYIYRLWQALHLNQAKSIAGTITIFNQPPSRDARLDDPIQMNYLNMPTITNEEMMSTLDGEPLCYIYV